VARLCKRLLANPEERFARENERRPLVAQEYLVRIDVATRRPARPSRRQGRGRGAGDDPLVADRRAVLSRIAVAVERPSWRDVGTEAVV
jgi:hypothetical protein